MAMALWAIAVLMLVCVMSVQKFMRDMAVVEKDLLKEIKEMKSWLIKINEKQV